MSVMLAIAALIPLAALAVMQRRERRGRRWYWTLLRTAILFGIGLYAAAPFLSDRAMGTGEAYNYSLAVADAVTQMRAGELPVLAGQTEFASNGRVHPLRHAPYMFHLAGLLDALSLRRLTFWELQNLSLALSLIAAVFCAYAGLRWSLDCPRPAAVFLAAAYGCCPSLLGAAYGMDLYMTVHAAPFVPLAIGAVLRHSRRDTPLNDAVMAAAMAATWSAHPPTALWLTAACAVLRTVLLVLRPSWRAVAGCAGAAILGLALTSFVFAATSSMAGGLSHFPVTSMTDGASVNALWNCVRSVFPACFLPISREACLLSDLQFGYAAWVLLLLAILGTARVLPRGAPADRITQLLSASLILGIGFLLLLTLPVPVVTPWLWRHMPELVLAMTNIWPMQRLYLLATALTVFAFALAIQCAPPAGARTRGGLVLALLAGTCLVFWQAKPFVARGSFTQQGQEATRRSHLSANLDLTITAYAFLGTPPSYSDGVSDPRFGFQLLRHGRVPLASPLRTALETAPVVARGSWPADHSGHVSTRLQLKPARRYLLTVSLPGSAKTGLIEIAGSSLERIYLLPAQGSNQPEAAGNPSRVISLWTDERRTEEAVLDLYFSERAPSLGRGSISFVLQEVDPSAPSPVRLVSLLPLRCKVQSPEGGCYLETLRRFIPGYRAFVNEREVLPGRSPGGNVMVPVPAGASEIELRYCGSPLLRDSFLVSAGAWIGFLVWMAGRLCGIRWANLLAPIRRLSSVSWAWSAKRWGWLLVAAIGAIAVPGGWYLRAAYLGAVGPIRLRLVLPANRLSCSEPVLSTGRSGAGTLVFLEYSDADHVRIGADIWGRKYLSEPIAVDYGQPQEIVVSSSALYPPDHPRFRRLNPWARASLRNKVLIELNEHAALTVPGSAFDSGISEIAIGRNRIGASSAQPDFTGKILAAERLPIGVPCVLASSDPLRLRMRFPSDRAGSSEPLLSIGSGGREGVLYATYFPGNRLLVGFCAPDGSRVESAPRLFSPAAAECLSIRLGRGATEAAPPIIRVDSGDAILLGPKSLRSPSCPLPVTAGFGDGAALWLSSRFTGPQLEVTEPRFAPCQPVPTGALRLLVFLPGDKTGRQEPLVVTGRTGAGDFAYVVYIDASHVKFGVDHWAVGGALSETIPIDFAAPHLLEVSMGSLFMLGATTDKSPDADRRHMTSRRRISLDGRVVLDVELPCYPALPGDPSVGRNPIGGSTCEAVFSGLVYAADGAAKPVH